jgi:hypothetical protein
MVPWIKLGKVFAGHFFVNWVKTLLGAAMVGYGMSILHNNPRRTVCNGPGQEEDDHDDDDGDHKDSPKTSPSFGLSSRNHTERYVSGSILIGFGLFLSLPSLLSQVVWETAIPGLSAASIVGTDVTSDMFTLGVTDYFKSLKSTVSDWKPSIGGGGGGGNISRGNDQSRGITSKFVQSSSNEINIRDKE